MIRYKSAARPHTFTRHFYRLNTCSALSNPSGFERRSYSLESSRQKDDLWSCNSLRFLWNEKEQLASRYVKFDVEALKWIACKVTKAERCTSFRYHNEDVNNRYFLMVLDERLPLIVRIPFENAIPVSSSIMSDAATLTFLRDILNLKVPNVIAYSEHNTPQHNPVGREFLIYEHVPGLSLQSIWTSISGRQVASLITQIFSQTEAVPGAVPFSQSGSLYFKDDVSLELQSRSLFTPNDSDPILRMGLDLVQSFDRKYIERVKERLKAASDLYRIGPMADTDLWRRGRSKLALDRGPWHTMSHYLTALAQNQIQWLRTFPRDDDRARRPPFHGKDYQIEILRILQDVVPFISPSEPREEPHDLEAPTLWHSKLQLSDVILPDESSEHISAIHGWKSSFVLPYCLQATFQPVFRYRGNRVTLPQGLDPLPGLEETLKMVDEEISEEEKAALVHEHGLASRHRFYERLLALEERRVDVLLSKHCWNINILPLAINRSWEDSIVGLRDTLYTLHDEWESFTNYPRPTSLVKLVHQNRDEHEREVAQYRRYGVMKKKCLAELGARMDGMLAGQDNDYAEAVRKLEKLKVEWNEHELGGPFPLQDGQL